MPAKVAECETSLVCADDLPAGKAGEVLYEHKWSNVTTEQTSNNTCSLPALLSGCGGL